MAVFMCTGKDRFDEEGNPRCNYEATQPWKGRCPGCGAFFNIRKYGVEKKSETKRVTTASSSEVSFDYISTGIDHVDYVLNGGVVKGQVILFGGPGGTGKSSLLAQILNAFTTKHEKKALYVHAEEGVDGVLRICNRLGIANERIELMGHEGSNIHAVLSRCDEIKPAITVFDSLQRITSDEAAGGPGSTAQGDAVAQIISKYCRKTKMVAIIVNHMNKALDFKGSTDVGHEVDTLLRFYTFVKSEDGKPRDLFGKQVASKIDIAHLRTLISGKSRMGPSDLKAFFLMGATGLSPVPLKPPKSEENDEDEEEDGKVVSLPVNPRKPLSLV